MEATFGATRKGRLSVGKKLIKLMAIGLMVLAPLGVVMAASVSIKSDTALTNVTQGSGQYSNSVQASPADQVKIKIHYQNREKASSGNIAKQLRVKVGLPTAIASQHPITTRVGAQNSNTVTETVAVNTSAATRLEYVPDSANWTRNIGTNDRPNWVTHLIDGSSLLDTDGLLLQNVKPGSNFGVTVSMVFRVKSGTLSVDKQVRVVGQTQWTDANKANPEDTLEYVIRVRNNSPTTLYSVVVNDVLPANVSYVSGSARLTNAVYPNGTPLGISPTGSAGVNIGNYAPGQSAEVYLRAQIDTSKFTAPGRYKLLNTGTAKAYGLTPRSDATTTNMKVSTPTPPPVPSFRCEGLSASIVKGQRPLSTVFTAWASVSEGQIQSYLFNFGDGQTGSVTTAATPASINHTYASVGTYTATVRVQTSLGTTNISNRCSVQIRVTEQPEPPQPPTPTTPSGISITITNTNININNNTVNITNRQ